MAKQDISKEQCFYSKVCQSPISRGQLNEKIKEVAQKLYEKRGHTPGHELDDWLKAERIVKKGCE